MKKGFKIIGISLASVVGMLLLVAAVLVWVVFTPSRLTPIVRTVADKVLSCEHSIGQVELTFFSTFPQFTLCVDSVVLVNDVDGAPCDTLLRADCLRAEVNLRQLWQSNAIDLDELLLDGVDLCLYTDSLGQSNYNVFVQDSVDDDTDTTTFSLPFEWMDLRQVSLDHARIAYVDEQHDVCAHLAEAKVDLTLKWQGETVIGDMSLHVPNVCASMGGVTYVDGVSLATHLPFDVSLEALSVELHKATLAVNQLGLSVDGRVSLPANGAVVTDVCASFDSWDIQDVLQLVPDSFSYLLSDFKVDSGKVSLSAEVKGELNDSVYPQMRAHVQLQECAFAHSALPTPLHGVNADVTAYVNLNDSTDSYADVKLLSVGVKNSAVEVRGKIERLLADVAVDASVDADFQLEDFAAFLPQDANLDVSGQCSGNVHTCFTLDQLVEEEYDQIHLKGDVDLARLAVALADWHVQIPEGNVTLVLPHEKHSSSTNFASFDVMLDQMHVQQGDKVSVDAQDMKLAVAMSNPLQGNMLHVGCEMEAEHLSALYGSIKGALSAPLLSATLALNQKDTTDVPMLDASLQVDFLEGNIDTISMALHAPQVKVNMRPSSKHKKEPILTLDYIGQALTCSMGNMVHVSADSLSLSAFARHRSGVENMLLEWNPRLNIHMTEGLVTLANFEENIIIPTIQLDYSNRDFIIKDSRIRLGNSDFQLTGEIKDINKFIAQKGLLTGELDFVSNTTDVNQLMSLVSGLGSTKEELAEEASVVSAETAASVEETMPFIVPKGVDLTLHTTIQRALVGEQVATNLGGNLYVKDGTLILEEMGFICDAARLQLTAMYQSPRPNHLYVGLDYHMTDIQIEELINMIPQVDSVLPMLRSFRGKGEFHLAAETNLNRHYDLKWSTLRGAASIQGKDLVLLDGETFSQIAKLMLFKKKTENKIDSISAEATVFRNEVDIFPFLVSMDKYKVALGGRHNLDMTFNYHLSLLSPLRIGVDVSGNFDDLKIRLSKCKYADDFRPAERKTVETQNMTFRELIRQSLLSTLKE